MFLISRSLEAFGLFFQSFIGRALSALKEVTPPIANLHHEEWLVTHHEDRFLLQVRKVINRAHQILWSELQEKMVGVTIDGHSPPT
jgi:hypothetical protein